MSAIRTFRLHAQEFWVDVRLYEVDGRWLASADTPAGPSLRTGWTPLAALVEALEPFDGVIDELLGTVPPGLMENGRLDY